MRNTPDYLGNPHHANTLANRITRYWKERGMPEWKARVVVREITGKQGKVEKFYDIRSNIKVTRS